MATKGTKAIKDAEQLAANTEQLAAGRKAIEEAAQKKDSSQLRSALLGYVGILEQTQKGLSFPGNKAAKQKVVNAFVKDAVGLRGYNIALLYADTLTELAGKNTDAAGQFFCGAPELYHRLGPRYVSEFVAQGLSKKMTLDYFAGDTQNLDARSALHDLVKKEHLEYVGNYRKLGEEFKQHKADADKDRGDARRHSRNMTLIGSFGSAIMLAVGGWTGYSIGTHQPSSSANRARIEQLVDQRDEYKARLSSVEAQRDQVRAALNTTYAARIHDAIANPQSLMEIIDEYLGSIGGRVRFYGPGCESSLEHAHAAMSGYTSDRAAFVDASKGTLCARRSETNDYTEFRK